MTSARTEAKGTRGRLEALLRPERLLTTAALIVCAVTLLPVITIVVLALSPAPGVWPQLLSSVLPGAVRQTLLLMTGVGLLTLLIGTGTAWLVTIYTFPGRGLFNWLLILPLALPTYICAYCYGAFLHDTGPLQTGMRALGFTSFHEDWLPLARSLGGAVIILSAVLYPYVYLAARASFLQQSRGAIEAARMLRRGGLSVFWEIGLPMARPALAAGVSLVLMECLNDIGAVEYLGVRTLTVSVFQSSLQPPGLAGAAPIALVLLPLVLILIPIERWARLKHRFDASTRQRPYTAHRLIGPKAWLATAACAIPVLIGFVIPVGVLLRAALLHGAAFDLPTYRGAATASLMLALTAAAIVVTLAMAISTASRIVGGFAVHVAARSAALGYAIPGTLVALGIALPLAGLDNALGGAMRWAFSIETGQMLSGSAAALLIAYTIHFLALGLDTVEAGWLRLPPHLASAAHILGAGPLRTLFTVHLPLLRPALGAAALLVFVATMRELPATLLLRSADIETLATQIYVFASQEQFERQAIAALTIVAVGLIPLLLLNRTLRPAHAAVAKGTQDDAG